jgi:NSS family neurotransmitter:Na+ symporter
MTDEKVPLVRDSFGSTFGAIAAAAGAAVGLGNIWNFPYMTGRNGGGAFLLIYVLAVVLIGVPIMIAELILGKRGQRNIIGSFRSLAADTRWHWVGWFCVTACFLILGFYGVIAGWSFAHAAKALGGVFNALGANQMEAHFMRHIAHPFWPVFWHLLFMAATAVIVVAGVRQGIERFSKIFMPVLLSILIVLAIRSVTLDGAAAGLSFLFQPDFSKISAQTILVALGAAFFSLGIGNGVMVTFGSYLRDDTAIGGMALKVSITDTAVAIIAGVAIFPAVFALGYAPANSSGLAFVTVPSVFQSVPGGALMHYLLTLLFFLLLSIAALTSSVATLEVVVATFTEEFGMDRRRAPFVIAGIMLLIGVPCALSMGAVPINVLGMAFFDFVILLVEGLFLPVGGLLIVLFVGWRLSRQDVASVLASDGHMRWYQSGYLFLIRFVVPVLIVAVLFKTLLDGL